MMFMISSNNLSFFVCLEVWHQFDGVCYIYGERRWWERFYDYFRSEETLENRSAAVLAYLPKWKGFLVGEALEEMDATKALAELDRVVDGLTYSWVMEGGLFLEKRQPAYFKINTVN